jgi:hypothetical protein
VGPEVGYLGCYFNDAGINPMHDEFFAPMGTEAAAILRVAQRWGPDMAVSLHSCGHPPGFGRPEFAPVEVQDAVRVMGTRFYERITAQEMPCQKAEWTSGGYTLAKHDFVNLTSAIHHTSGATAFSFESAHGTKGECEIYWDKLLEIQMTLYELMLETALERKGGT